MSIKSIPPDAQRARDEPLYRAQLAYLLGHSEFYRAKLAASGIRFAEDAGGLGDLHKLPFTEKDELRASRDAQHPIGTHLAAPLDDVVRIYSTSGTTGTPSYIPLTAQDLENWIEISTKSYGASGLSTGERMVTTYNAGPFVAGVTLDAFARIGVCHIPVGAGNTERLMTAIQLLKPTVLGCTPSYALYLAEWAEERGIDIAASTVNKLLVAGEPGGGEPEMRRRIEAAWRARNRGDGGRRYLCLALGGMHRTERYALFWRWLCAFRIDRAGNRGGSAA